MKSFIRQCVDEILKDNRTDYSDQLLVFPTRRACLFFKKEFSQAIEKPLWAPVVISINEFMEDFSGLAIPDKLSLIFELFEIYKKHFPEESFDAFYPWGQMLLNDFDEIDRGLVNAHALFSHISDIKKIEGDFAVDEEDLIAVQKFWHEISGEEKEISILKKEFLKIWNSLGAIYEEFRKRLLDKQTAYEGLAFRMIAEGQLKIDLKHARIIFAGFYAPSRAEQGVILRLKEKKKALVWADADSYYTDSPSQEAGKFFRKKGIWEENFSWKGNYFEENEKHIEVCGVPLQYGQARAVGNKLQELFSQENFSTENTAVVLPDENMLFPILYAIPGEIEHLNVTMGYPLRNTPLFHLFTSMFQLLKNARVEDEKKSLFDKKTSFYFKDVIRLIQHPYIMQAEPEKCRAFLKKMNENGWIRVPSEELQQKNQPASFHVLFSNASISDVASYFMDVISFLSNTGIKDKKLKLSEIEKEYFFHFYTMTRRLGDLLSGAKYKADIGLYHNLLLEIIQSSRIPFSGEPLNGLQIMGFLETRVLDFDNILMPSLNEGILPPASKKHSYIPYSIRKAYGLATFEDHDAIYAYHFYRLLQRAKNIFLYYDTEVKSLSGGEKSRYLLQLKYELSKKFSNIHFSEKLLSSQISSQLPDFIEIPKDLEVMKKLRAYFYQGPAGKDDKTYFPSFSATAMSSYINCSLQFYFRYLAGLKELEEVEEGIDSKTFGSIFHKAMELFYEGQNEISLSFLEKQKEKISEIVGLAFKEILKGHDHETGKNLLVKSVISELIKRMIYNDMKDAPFQMIQQEQEMNIPFRFSEDMDPIMLRGFIDRIDKKDGVYRILDYKTGKVEIKNVDIPEFFSDPAHKISLQAFLYGWMYRQEIKSEKIRLGIYPVRKPIEGIVYLQKAEPIPDILFDDFENELKKLFQEIYNPLLPFKQTEDKEKCTYCAYKVFCGISS